MTRSYTVIQATNVDGGVNGSVAATLSLVLGSPATFGAFTPGVTRDYSASDDRDRDLLRRQRDAQRRRPERRSHRPPGQRRVLPAQAMQSAGRRITPGSAPTTELSPVPLTFKQTIGERGPAYGLLREDADVHAQHHYAVKHYPRGPAIACTGPPTLALPSVVQAGG